MEPRKKRYKSIIGISVIVVVIAIICVIAFIVRPSDIDPSEKKPPELKIGFDKDNTQVVSQYGYQWSWMEGRKKQNVIADSIHPLIDDDITTINIDDDSILYFDFGITPDEVICYSWDSQYAKDENSFDSDYSIEKYDYSNCSLKIENRSQIVMIQATWNNMGKSTYGFRVHSNSEQELSNNADDYCDMISLPEKYSFSEFDQYGGYGGCFYILPLLYESDQCGEGTPKEWTYSGILGKVPSNLTSVKYSNKIPELAGEIIENHTVSDYLEVLELDNPDARWYAIVLEESHDLYTAVELDDLREEGKDMSQIDSTSDYWYFWFVKEDAENYYVLSLSKKEFTKEEAIKIAESVVVNE